MILDPPLESPTYHMSLIYMSDPYLVKLFYSATSLLGRRQPSPQCCMMLKIVFVDERIGKSTVSAVTIGRLADQFDRFLTVVTSRKSLGVPLP